MHSRIEREHKTVKTMIGLYCRKRHAGRHLCPECAGLVDYAGKRLSKCPFQDGKTTCAKCPTHCFKPEMREKIRVVMRYSGPRMIWYHTFAAVQHLIDERRENPVSLHGKNVKKSG